MSSSRTGRSTSTVLVADGNTRLAQVLAQLLDDEDGFRVQEVCHTAQQALDAAARGRPDVVLLSARLPGATAELCRDLRVASPGARVLLWATDATGSPDAAAADGVLQRGMTFREVVAALRRSLAGLPVPAEPPPAPVPPSPSPGPAPPPAPGADGGGDDALVLNCDSCGVHASIPTEDMGAAVEQGREFFARHDRCRTSISLPDRAVAPAARP